MCNIKSENIDKEKRRLAFEKAHEIRKFEIELYWKRTTYFWAFIAFSFGAYIAVVSSENKEFIDRENYAFIITCIGFIFSLSWYLVNRASKNWQNYWEKVIESLEDDFTGAFMKRQIENNNKWYELTLLYRYSVSRVNQIVSLFVAIVWLLLMGFSAYQIFSTSAFSLSGNRILPILFFFVTIAFIFFIIKYGKAGNPEEKVNFKRILDKNENCRTNL